MTAMLQPRYASKIHARARPTEYFHESLETLSRAALEKVQLRRLRATVKRAFEAVPLHRRRMEAAGITPRDVRTLDDVRSLPFTLKSDLREHYPFGLFARPRTKLARLHASSGTTGKPTVVGYTRHDIALGAGLMAHAGDVVHNAYGYGLFTGGLGAHYGAEPWSEAMRREIESRLGLRAFDIYGLSEIMGPGVAVECEAQDGLHGWEDHFLFEVIDPQTGQPLADGESGELVITTLTKQALPMLRYRTRDITRLARRACACGRTHARLQRITGRNDDMLIIRGVNVYPSQIEAVLVGLPGIAPHYQLVLERKGSLDELTIEVEASDAGAAERVRHHVKSMIGVSAAVKVMKPGEVPRSQGKAVRVRDLRPKA